MGNTFMCLIPVLSMLMILCMNFSTALNNRGIGTGVTQFYFLRHAEGLHNLPMGALVKDWATNPIFMDAQLTPTGHSQTLEKRLAYGHVKFDAIYTSPMRRCRQTLLGVWPNAANLSVVVDDRLIEIPSGIHICNKRVERDEIIATSPSGWNFDRVSENNPFQALTQEMEDEKIISFTNYILKQHPNHKILVVAHSGVIWRWFKLFKDQDVWLPNCEIAIATLKKSESKNLYYDDGNRHL
jgi:broad specificity phosphatase PhoE